MALWGGRFEAGVAEVTQEFGASLPVDKHLYKQDIAGSKAHAKMLAAQGIISAEDEQAIAKGLTGIEQDIDAGNFTFDINDEDIHMSIESELTRRIGEAGKRLHTGVHATTRWRPIRAWASRRWPRSLWRPILSCATCWWMRPEVRQGDSAGLHAHAACSARAAVASSAGVFLDVRARLTRLKPPLMLPTTARWALPRLPVRAIRSIVR